MFCQKCGTELDVNATECISCNARTTPAQFCQKCGETMPGDASICGACNTRITVPNSPLHWLSIGLSGLAFITFGVLGGDYALNEVNLFDWVTIPIAAAAILVAIVCIPKGRMALKVISIILAAFFLFGSIGWVLI